MEITNEGKIKCNYFYDDLTVIDCVSLMDEDCGGCALYQVHKEIKEEIGN